MPVFHHNNPARPWMHPTEKKKGSFSNNEHVHLYHSSAWRRLRKAKIEANPLCECDECKLLIVPKPAHHVDHIKAVKDGGDFFAWDNIQSLNLQCHNKKSATEKNR